MKKVLLICSLYHPHVGGIETMVRELSRIYKRLGVDVTVLTKRWPDSLPEEDSYESIPIFRIKNARTDDEFMEVDEWIRLNEKKIKADIIHVIGVRRPLPLIALQLKDLWNVPLVLTIAGGDIPDKNDPFPETIWKESEATVYPVFEHADLITCVSESIARDFRELFPNVKRPIKTMLAGIDLAFIKGIERQELPYRYIFSLRRLDPTKGIDILIRAFKEVVQSHPNIKLVIAGDGSEHSRLEGLARDLDVMDRVQFLGTIGLDQGIGLLKGALLAVVPSLSEAGGLVNVEAQAAGCPVVASRVGGIPEYVNDGNSGVLCEPENPQDLAEKILCVLGDADLRARIIAGGYKHSRMFDWEVLAPQYMLVYAELIKGNKRINTMSFKYRSQIEAEFGLHGPLSFELVHNGPDNQVHIITDAEGNKYALRSAKRVDKVLPFEIEVLATLASVGFTSPRLVKTKSGSYSTLIDEVQMVLFDYITGWQVEKLEPEHLASGLIERGAVKLGALHRTTKGMNVASAPSRTIFTEYERFFALKTDKLSELKGYAVFLVQAHSFFKEAHTRLERGQEMMGVIHNDYRVQNLIFTDKDCTVIDFDWACSGPLLKDIGLAIAEWSLFKSSVGPSREAIDVFLRGYNQISPKAVNYDKDLLFWICFACLSDACTFFADLSQGGYADKNITDAEQCFMYRKFSYFQGELNRV